MIALVSLGFVNDGPNCVYWLQKGSLRKVRNTFLFSGMVSDPSLTWLLAHDAFVEFSKVNHLDSPRQAQDNDQNHQWTPPPSDYIKINCDDSFVNSSCSATGAAVFCDSYGTIVKGVSKSF
ncbi:hypothetical protein V6N11_010620 [Hibiscus sabdariffa]|uniref:RNase H type-1 domain-containing protein n=1 Tax=Hibiscus sabdariffa TaxID=183260 RepID=A0ABR2S6E6_9ROSI